MSDASVGSRQEIERMRRVADQLCTAHAHLRDKYSARALMLDTAILLLAGWLSSVALIDPRFNQFLIPLNIDPTLWIGLLSILTFLLTIVQLKVDWKGRSESHKRSFGMYAEVKREAGYILASSSDVPFREFQRLAARYDMASDLGIGVPESEFLKLKQRHKTKVEVSKLLDERPAANISLTKFKLFVRDNWLCR